ncbi:MAG: L-seryl-tRNA(Sec) selenium transferase [Alphaproteobacteria bacterium]|nr:L-seryl-tRNA(Sec) selenium transferase [Alphaproteobacteria bacterium]MBU2083490.1 L-seryl-tRNA(Sec) selenium transferase [Alphaproteobacteria bacterium]MBU2143544.1 L-seryl-tRNA(Sec) selenium transferase [Alphaproteobacteria bacterium]MBU2196055.1 L-seryl-tRNA(Sec) selenium transferase [Alphaproteobacteria bacterium]
MDNLLRQLPQMQALLDTAHIGGLLRTYTRQEVTSALRSTLQALRGSVRSGRLTSLPDFDSETFATSVASHIEAERRPNIRSVINATGIIIHTNLGRARLAPEALDAIQAIGANYSNLELDLHTGKRGSRHSHVENLICDLTGAEAALVVNNCASAVLLSLMATAHGKKVIASRGELIEIGGAFRLPDVIEQSGAILKEVGSTNKTRAADYERAVDSETAVLLKSHTSNFRIVGFTSAPKREDLAIIARNSNTILMEDLGSGVLIDLSAYGLRDEPVVSDILKSGVDLVMFSGDKLLGGPQSGIIAGRGDLVGRLKSHPLCRAVRLDKLSLAGLEATLRLYREPHDPFQSVPVLRAIAQTIGEIRGRADRLADALIASGLEDVTVAKSAAYVGGGSLPQQDLESYAVSLSVPSYTVDAIVAALRAAETPIVGLIRSNRFVMDARTLTDEDLPFVLKAFRGLRGR